MSNNYLHLTVVFQGSNLNYGEGVGNILSLKKMVSKGKNYSYISRQAIRYDIVRMLSEMCGYEMGDVDKERGVIQFTEEATIDKYPEIDFFGYMKTGSSNIRRAPLRLTDAVSLEPFANDMDFGTNKGLADRIEGNKGNDIFQSEIHKSYYCYSVSFDLREIGEDTNYETSLSKKEKAERVANLLNVIKLLYRDIRGKRENMSPVLTIGGLYDCGNPFFYNRIDLEFASDSCRIKSDKINDILQVKTPSSTVEKQTMLGALEDEFSNISDIKLEKLSIENFFDKLTGSVRKYYGAK